jgi:hypothetical protein
MIADAVIETACIAAFGVFSRKAKRRVKIDGEWCDIDAWTKAKSAVQEEFRDEMRAALMAVAAMR